MKTDRLPVIDLIAAELVYDYTPKLTPAIPHQLWPEGITTPHGVDDKLKEAGQFQGTNAERLAEIAGRSCYDSFGKGRTSEAFHAHILEVNHGSVYEHYNFTVEVDVWGEALIPTLMALQTRPGVWVEFATSSDPMRITLNYRSAVEWHQWTRYLIDKDAIDAAYALGTGIRRVAADLAPNIVKLEASDENHEPYDCVLVEPETDEERWITMLLTGSRGFSHELVRHGDRTAISQRSTRYVDENESPWVWHPLIHQYIDETSELNEARVIAENFQNGLEQVESSCKVLYGEIVDRLQPWMRKKLIAAAGGQDNLDKAQIRNLGFSARKQARGAARGFLGNALYTEVVFSASVAQWNRILRQRAGMAADAEIRESFAEKVLPILQSSYYGDCFGQWELFDCEDGIGKAAREVV